MQQNSLFIFRNDLRIIDNTALIAASKNSQIVFPIFIFHQEQIDKRKNEFYNEKIVAFMLACLAGLREQIQAHKGQLNFFYGDNEEVISGILQQNPSLKNLYVNRDYTPFARNRDEKIKNICARNQVNFYSFDDRILNPPENVLKEDKSPYTVFTPYYKSAKELPVTPPSDFTISNFSAHKLNTQFSTTLEKVHSLVSS